MLRRVDRRACPDLLVGPVPCYPDVIVVNSPDPVIKLDMRDDRDAGNKLLMAAFGFWPHAPSIRMILFH